jgi:hypothetical protein
MQCLVSPPPPPKKRRNNIDWLALAINDAIPTADVSRRLIKRKIIENWRGDSLQESSHEMQTSVWKDWLNTNMGRSWALYTDLASSMFYIPNHSLCRTTQSPDYCRWLVRPKRSTIAKKRHVRFYRDARLLSRRCRRHFGRTSRWQQWGDYVAWQRHRIKE